MPRKISSINPGEKTSWSGDDKRRFRARKQWKDFVQEAIEAQVNETGHNYCTFCDAEQPASKLDYHHLDPSHYDVLDHSKFKLLDTKCHDLVEWMAIRLATGGSSVRKADEIKKLFDGFLPIIKRKSEMLYEVAKCLKK